MSMKIPIWGLEDNSVPSPEKQLLQIYNRINVQAGTQFNMEHSDHHYVNDMHRDFHAEFDFTAGVSYNITENNELGIKLTIRPNETALGVSYNYWIF